MFYGCVENKQKTRTDTKEVGPKEVTETQVRTDSKELPKYMVKGKEVYDQYCLSCHQANGSGVARLNPPLKDTEYVLGDKDRLLGILINGANVGLEVKGETYSNAMPAFRQLSDEEIVHVASYIRNTFGNSAAPVTTKEVSDFRERNEG